MKVAFLGRPADALSFISSSVGQEEDERGRFRSCTLSENPADSILDMLNARDASRRISQQYDNTLKRRQTQQINFAVASNTSAGKLISSLLMSDMDSYLLPEGQLPNPGRTSTFVGLK